MGFWDLLPRVGRRTPNPGLRDGTQRACVALVRSFKLKIKVGAYPSYAFSCNFACFAVSLLFLLLCILRLLWWLSVQSRGRFVAGVSEWKTVVFPECGMAGVGNAILLDAGCCPRGFCPRGFVGDFLGMKKLEFPHVVSCADFRGDF